MKLDDYMAKSYTVRDDLRSLLEDLGIKSARGPVYFGDGSDGNATINGSAALVRDMHYQNLDIGPQGLLKTNGNRIYVRGVMQLDGKIVP